MSSFTCLEKQVNDVNNTHIIYSYGQEDELLGEYDASGNRIREYVYLREGETPELVAMVDASGQVLAVHTDHLGTPRLVMDNNKTIVWRWVSDAFGNGVANEDVDGNGQLVTLNHRFAGQYFDEESGLYYNYYRFYDPQSGRYITSDPIGLEAGLNTYGYVLQNPLNYNDPTGEIIPALIGAGRLGYMAYKGYKKYKQARRLIKRAQQLKKLKKQRKQRQSKPKANKKQKKKCPSKKNKGNSSGKNGWKPSKTEKHHTIPKEIQKKLPPEVAKHKDVVGRKGLPNKKSIPYKKHREIHKGAGGGKYNQRFDQEIKKRGGYQNVSPKDVTNIRDKLVKEFGL